MKDFNFLNLSSIYSGSDNANNGCIAFPDGTLICYGKIDKYVEFSAYLGAYRAVITNPFTFYTTVNFDGKEKKLNFLFPPVVIVGQASDADYAYASVTGVERNLNAITKITFERSSAITDWLSPHYIAIGRWK